MSNPNNRRTTFASDSTKERKRGEKMIDDSTKLVYGAYTTKFFLESDWFYNTERLRKVDTLLTNMHRYKFVERAGWELQNLGNLATASRQVYYQEPEEIGNRLGISAFEHLYLKSSEIKYYNTKSPYTRWYLVQGGQGRSFLEAEMAQNINPRVNVVFTYRRITNRLLLGTKKTGRSEDRQADFQNVLVQTSIQSADGRYKILGHFNSGTERMDETGGLVFDDDLPDLRSLFELERRDLDNRLDDANGFFQKQKFHVYQQFSLIDSTQFQLYHELNWTYRRSTFSDSQIDTTSEIFPNAFLTGTTTDQETRFDEVDNRVGVKFRKERCFWRVISVTKHLATHSFSTQGKLQGKPNRRVLWVLKETIL